MKNDNEKRIRNMSLRKFNLNKKLALFLLFTTFLQIRANSYSDKGEISLDIERSSTDDKQSAVPKLIFQQIISGVVIDDIGAPLPGASIVLKGTSNGTVTDFDGNFSISVEAENAVLVVSYLGFLTQEVVVGDSQELTIQMQPDANGLDEVVVTALGIKRQRKSLTYSSQNVDLETLDEVRPAQNLVNSLQGKVAGLSIVKTGNGVSGSSRVNLRGNRSIDGSSQPLYVIDGVPIGGDISDISPDDIASINVLKGGNAAALYGSRANNGAIIITTKSGGADRLSIDFGVTTTMETGKIFFDFQDQYGQGVGGSYFALDGSPLSGSMESWGQALDESLLVPHWSPDPSKQGILLPYGSNPNRHDDFLQTGATTVYSLSARAGNEKSQLYFGYTNDSRKGITPGNEMTRHNVSIKLNQKLINDKLVLDAKMNYIRTDLDNELSTGNDKSNPYKNVYLIPNNIRNEDLREFEYTWEDGNVLQNYWLPGANGGANAYWVANRNLNEQFTNRILSYASLTYNFTDKLSLMGRSAFETSSNYMETRWSNDTYIIAQNGAYTTMNSQYYDWNTDFLLSYNDQFSEDIKYSLNVGGNNRQVNGRSVSTNNNGLSVPNIFALSNALQATFSETINRKEVQSLYAFGQTSFKNLVFLDLTYRNDWSSSLPEANRSFGYYSAGLSAVVSDMFDFGNGFSYLKLRGSFAEVGNDTDPFKLSRAAELRSGGLIYLSTILPNEDLKSEKTLSKEIGFDAGFFNGRLGLDFTYYKTNSTDQLFAQDVPLGSGVAQKFLNGADIENRGVEVILTGNPVHTDDFDWDVTLNFSKNTSEVKKLAEGLDRLSIGTTHGIRLMQLTVGSEWGDYYARGYERDSEGRIIVDASGLPETTSGKSVKVANYNPDWLGGVRNTFKYKGFDMSFLIDIRQGGTVISGTLAALAAGGFSEITAAGRDGSLVVGQNILGTGGAVKADGTPNDIQVNAEDLWKSLGKSEEPVGEAFVEDASNIRLREFSLGYNIQKDVLNKIGLKHAKISLVGSNLFFFSRKAQFDPEITIGTGTEEEGYEFNSTPFTRSMGLNVKFGF
ncbi:SusC/RagA family TonB-linked outer membrane protein [Arenibacter sp. F26102]|uniref:SusC/RagA family TonB-linked outer membrane protein n=1 Tax=Arenibacter sp. F26102 TaxID=2926416 RepID=UPI001FF48937|nr:SusC/RagA family TonB-linked outer membrane protein [Arenibacter sp. F26102]MCK0144942.1 SusC/RagA family TonB-linked outer membrane protein [Arenibacter sp. F26102]